MASDRGWCYECNETLVHTSRGWLHEREVATQRMYPVMPPKHLDSGSTVTKDET